LKQELSSLLTCFCFNTAAAVYMGNRSSTLSSLVVSVSTPIETVELDSSQESKRLGPAQRPSATFFELGYLVARRRVVCFLSDWQPFPPQECADFFMYFIEISSMTSLSLTEKQIRLPLRLYVTRGKSSVEPQRIQLLELCELKGRITPCTTERKFIRTNM
jgi:hypothetical protein